MIKWPVKTRHSYGRNRSLKNRTKIARRRPCGDVPTDRRTDRRTGHTANNNSETFKCSKWYDFIWVYLPVILFSAFIVTHSPPPSVRLSLSRQCVAQSYFTVKVRLRREWVKALSNINNRGGIFWCGFILFIIIIILFVFVFFICHYIGFFFEVI